MSKYVYIDFEFNNTSSPKLNLVCVVFRTNTDFYQVKQYWLHGHRTGSNIVKKEVEKYHKEGYTFVAYGVMAEARSFIALDIDPTKLRWIDLYCEHRMLLNHFDKHKYGKQLVDGEVKRCIKPKPKWEREDGYTGGPQVNASYASACFHFCGIEVDTKHKTEMRDLIISAPSKFSDDEKKAILKYCKSDTVHLRKMLQVIMEHHKEYLPTKEHKNIAQYMLNRGAWAAANAVIEELGHPINYKATKNFSDSVPDIVKELQKDINSQFPDGKPFRFNGKDATYSWNQKLTREWINSKHKKWLQTKTKQHSLSLEAFQRYYSFTHDYPRGNFGAQIVRYLKTKQSLNGFAIKKSNRKTFWDSVGKDKRVRPFLNIYGSQSARNQPSATGFLFLKAAWMRSLCVPNMGRCIVSIDFGSEEFLIAALLSNDKNMIKAYESGDVYLYFAKKAGAVPSTATKQTHSALRDVFKTVVLATQYKMTSVGLSHTLTEKTGKVHTEEQAQDFLDDFAEVFPDYTDWSDELKDKYEDDGYLMLKSGWAMGPDNDNFRSAANFPVQGAGSDILRSSVHRAQAEGLEVVLTLHDALYVECDQKVLEETIYKLSECMVEGFKDYFRNTKVENSANVRLDGAAWGPNLPIKTQKKNYGETEMKLMRTYVDGRAQADYDRFSKYFEASDKVSLDLV